MLIVGLFGKKRCKWLWLHLIFCVCIHLQSLYWPPYYLWVASRRMLIKWSQSDWTQLLCSKAEISHNPLNLTVPAWLIGKDIWYVMFQVKKKSHLFAQNKWLLTELVTQVFTNKKRRGTQKYKSIFMLLRHFEICLSSQYVQCMNTLNKFI